MPPKILILGKGYVGKHLKGVLGERGSIVSREDLDYHNKKEFGEYLNYHPNIKVVVNCSGFTGRPNIDQAELMKEDCLNLNTISPLNVMAACNKKNVKYIHISSGCIYTGYKEEFEEDSESNFGMFHESSFYSKTKHLFEILAKNSGNGADIIRVRMPFCGVKSNRSYLTKILGYDKLIDYTNSKTSISELCIFIDKLASKRLEDPATESVYRVHNIVNTKPLTTSRVISILKEYGHSNENWSIVPIEDIDIAAPRSNCILKTSKSFKRLVGREIKSEEESIRESLK